VVFNKVVFFLWMITRYEYSPFPFLLKKQISMISKSLDFNFSWGMVV
jgi:hypothetical protein